MAFAIVQSHLVFLLDFGDVCAVRCFEHTQSNLIWLPDSRGCPYWPLSHACSDPP